jgi:protein-tyrosine kinase
MTTAALRALPLEPSNAADEPRIQAFASSLVTLESGQPASAEAFRALRTHVMAQHVEHGRRAVALCAPSGGVGCTFVAANLAIALSQIGVKTLLIDANLRHPGLEEHFTPTAGVSGLKQCLAEGDPISEHILPDVIPYLSLMFSGGVADNAQELLATAHFSDLMGSCMRDYDMTILDTPPANRCSDALRISNVVGYSMIVVRRDKTQLSDIRVLAGQLEGDGARVVGTVMTED